jgi:serine/threonine protein kinase
MTAAAVRLDMGDGMPSTDELPNGTQLLLGQYTITSFVNSGGFGFVYLAKDSLDRTVILKECFPNSYCRRVGTIVGSRSRTQVDDFRAAVRHFIQEAVTLSQLNHPNIVKVHQVFEYNETAYMAMDYVQGHDLLQTVEGKAARLTPDRIIAHLNTMLDAVGHVHAQGLLHRDISPDNMILDVARDQPVLIDFGASRKEVTRKSRAVSGMRIVKDGYSPQELYVSGSKQAPCSDLYALAASFYHLISGETPKTSQERLSAIAEREGDPLRPLAGRFRDYPAQFLSAIDKAMSVFPRDRLQSVDDWRAILSSPPANDRNPSRGEPMVLVDAPLMTDKALSQEVAAMVAASQALFQAEFAEPTPAAVPALAKVPSVALAKSAGLAPVAVPALAPSQGIVPSRSPELAAELALDLASDLALDPVQASLPSRTPSVVLEASAPDPVPVASETRRFWPLKHALVNAAAAAAILVGLLALPGLMPKADGAATSQLALTWVAGAELVSAELPLMTALHLQNGMVFEMVETETGTMTVVAAVPESLGSTMQVGDVLLTYSASGETLGTGKALSDLLKRELALGVTSYGFVIRRGESTMDAEFRLEVAG